MKIISTEGMKEFDRRTISEFGVPGELLMDRAGLGVAKVVRSIADLSGRGRCLVRLFAGLGNNGGDAFVVARYLKEWGFRVEVFVAGEVREIKGDAEKQFSAMKSAGIKFREIDSEGEWGKLGDREYDRADIIVDGLLGTGISGGARGGVACAIRHINDLGASCPVVAIDIPSGLNSDTGEAEGEVVKADVTVTMAFPKLGLVEPGAIEYTGSLEVVDIGVPAELEAELRSDRELITGGDVRALMGRRARSSHKGTFGHVLVIGGACGYSGAVAMSVAGALRAGAGLVSALVPRSIASAVASVVPEGMIHGVAETDSGSLSSDIINEWRLRIKDFDSVLIGPGMTTDEDARRILKRVLNVRRGPIVIDADALNLCAGSARGVIKNALCPVVITPHPGEMGQLLGCSAAEVQADRFGMVEKAVADMGVIVVLKGAGSIVAGADGPLCVNITGNPGMATGGMGDVLGGVLAALMAQGLDVRDASCAGVYVHGRAGDRAMWRGSQVSLKAGDVIEELPAVFREVMGR